MNHENLNILLRTIIQDLLNTGKYKKRDVVVATFGGGSSPQFEHFIKGSNVGINPLSRVFESSGYDLHVVPVPKNSKEAQNKTIKELDDDFVKDFTESLTNYLDSADKTAVRGSVSKVFENVAENILKDIL